MFDSLTDRVKGRSTGISQAALCVAACALFALPARSQQKPSNLADSSLEDLMNVQVTSVAISTSLIKMMGGQISVESEPGKGSTFMFTARFGQLAAEHLNAIQPSHPERVR